jgi:hypothetical protein
MNIEKPLFESAWLKIKRANHHIKDLISLVSSFEQPSRYSLRAEENPEAPGSSLVLEVDHEGIEDLPLIVGDAVHNLRTALDHVACELVTLSGGTPTYHTKFTIGETRKEAVTSIDGEIQGIGLDMITHLLEYVQPYRGGNTALSILHALDIADKHRLIVPIFNVFGVTFSVIRDGQKFTTVSFGIIRGEKTSMVEVHPGAEIEGYRHPMVHVLFDDIEGLKHQPVIPMLHQLRQVVSGTVQEVERAVRAIRE